jgi:hypothetical protein
MLRNVLGHTRNLEPKPLGVQKEGRFAKGGLNFGSNPKRVNLQIVTHRYLL